VGVGDSTALAVSADGRVVVGVRESTTTPQRGFFWTREQGVVELGTLPGDSSSFAVGASTDGSVIVGTSQGGSGTQTAVRWDRDPATGTYAIASLGVPGGWMLSAATGVSGDGSVIVGTLTAPDYAGRSAFRWTVQTGIVEFGGLSSGAWTYGLAVSGDGTTTVGHIDVPSISTPSRWNAAGIPASFSVCSGQCRAYAQAVSNDGSVVVGYTESFGPAFRWTSATGSVDLPVPTGATALRAFSMSGDGRVVGCTTASSQGGEATVWTASRGLINLNTYLPTRGVDLTGWYLSHVYGISADGRVLVGAGRHPLMFEAFVVELPPWCAADFNGVNGTDVQDILEFVNAWFASAPSADFNGVGGVTVQDIFDFLNAWLAGC
jgi:probable HAF family extracellular repeat protein